MGKELEKKNQTPIKHLCTQDYKFGDKIKQDHFSHKTRRSQTLNKYA